MSAAVDAVGDVSTDKLGLRIDAQQDAPTAKGATPCATPKGYRAIELEINPSTWKPDLSKCKVCGETTKPPVDRTYFVVGVLCLTISICDGSGERVIPTRWAMN